MIVYLLLSITLLIAFFSLLMLWRGRDSWLQLLCSIALAGFIYLYGVWVYLSVYTRYLFAALFVVTTLGVIFRKKKTNSASIKKVFPALGLILFTILDVLYFTGTTGMPERISLPLPFKNGDYFIFQGGKGLPANLFHYNSRHAIYAIDLVKLNDKGQRSQHIFSKDLNDYFIFGDTVYSPCEGVISREIDDNPDNIPPERKRGPHNLNSVLIEQEHFYLFMGHLKYKSVFVKAGDHVRVGTPLGLAGNSGSSLEPHLHIQAHSKDKVGEPWYRQEPLFINFYGKEYLLFQTISTHHSTH